MSVDGIYFDNSMLNQDMALKISEVINSNKSAIFSKLIKQKDPVLQFYGFVGFMKSNQKAAINYMEELIISSKKVIVFRNSQKFETTLGFAILSLINELPEGLTNKPIDDFYSLSEDKIFNAYNSSLSKNDALYSQVLTSLITNKYSNIAKKIFKETISFDNLKSKSLEEKITLSTMINSAPITQREKIIIDLLQERNDKISLNVLDIINENDSKNVADEIFQTMRSSISNEVLNLAVKKYSLIYKAVSIPNIEIFLKNIPPSKESLVLVCLEQIYSYGNENSYEFLKMFLETSYSNNVNLYALKTMIQTTYKTVPINVIRTFLYIIRYYEVEPVVIYTIKFFIENNVSDYHDMILSRIEKMNSVNSKKIGMDYIEYFKLKAGINYLKYLSNDEDYEIKNRANQIILKLESSQ